MELSPEHEKLALKFAPHRAAAVDMAQTTRKAIDDVLAHAEEHFAEGTKLQEGLGTAELVAKLLLLSELTAVAAKALASMAKSTPDQPATPKPDPANFTL